MNNTTAVVLNGMTLVEPPPLRPVESHFSKEALRVSYCAERSRVHAEHAIGVMKQWRFVSGRIPFREADPTKQISFGQRGKMDLVPLRAIIVAKQSELGQHRIFIPRQRRTRTSSM